MAGEIHFWKNFLHSISLDQLLEDLGNVKFYQTGKAEPMPVDFKPIVALLGNHPDIFGSLIGKAVGKIAAKHDPTNAPAIEAETTELLTSLLPVVIQVVAESAHISSPIAPQ